MLGLGTVRACPECKRGNVIIKAVCSYGPTQVINNWGDPDKPNVYEEKDDKVSWYVLDCGHSVSEEAVLQEGTTYGAFQNLRKELLNFKAVVKEEVLKTWRSIWL